MTVLAAGLFILSRLGPASPVPLVTLGLVVTGLGTGIFGSPNNNTLMGAAPRHRQGIAAGVLASARNTGMALGVGLAAAVVTTVLAQAPVGGPVPPIFHATARAFLVATGVALLGVVTSAVR